MVFFTGEAVHQLNEAQRRAVIHTGSPLLVIAGAGSGKTGVITKKIAHLAQGGLPPASIYALTFTNKAAREMQQRCGQLMKDSAHISTFHRLGLEFIRAEASHLQLRRNFTVLDNHDCLNIIKELSQETDSGRAQEQQNLISNYKNDGLSPEFCLANQLPGAALNQGYEQRLRAYNVLDFDDLLLFPLRLLRENFELRLRWQSKIRYLLVDEYQDTNQCQYELMKLLVGDRSCLTVVGDDDQSIYGWRGARVENILQLEGDFPALATVRLEQNYRSTQTILDAANAVIAQNQNRLGKTLWSDGQRGAAVRIYPAINEMDEARYVCEQIQRWHAGGGRYDESAILYRSNAQSRVFEEMLLQHRLPYRVYGGLRFFERAEIKDALAYLRLARYRDDDGAVERIINTPTRGIGQKTLTDLRQLAQQAGVPLWHILADDAQIARHFSGRARNALREFVILIEQIAAKLATEPSLKKALETVVHDTGLYAALETEGSEQAEARRENLDELINAGSYIDLSTDPDSDRIMDFLADAALDAGDGQAEEGSDSIQLMTLHSAKGLEFPNVYIVGMEEGLFPTQRAIESPDKLEEERRLAYVGMTRAERELTLCFAERRRFQGQENYPQPSRFIHEIPEELTEAVRPMVYSGISKMRRQSPAMNSSASPAAPYKLGDSVRHPKFGEGCVMALEGHGEHLRAQIHFAEAGEKWLVLAYAKLEKI